MGTRFDGPSQTYPFLTGRVVHWGRTRSPQGRVRATGDTGRLTPQPALYGRRGSEASRSDRVGQDPWGVGSGSRRGRVRGPRGGGGGGGGGG